jgi:hypothetical protein
MKITTYVKNNWDTLPKSTFNEDELVIVHEIRNSDEGYGHHSYEGVGVDRAGNVCWAYSSGCSCEGTCGVEHKPSTKVFVSEDIDVTKIRWQDVEFSKLVVEFRDYN